jgi:hypothetical protein
MCRTALLYLGQVAVANENLFSTSLPGEINKNSAGIGNPGRGVLQALRVFLFNRPGRPGVLNLGNR